MLCTVLLYIDAQRNKHAVCDSSESIRIHLLIEEFVSRTTAREALLGLNRNDRGTFLVVCPECILLGVQFVFCRSCLSRDSAATSPYAWNMCVAGCNALGHCMGTEQWCLK